MEFIDVILLTIIGGFALFGFWFGFVHTLGSLLGTVLGAFLASRYYEPMADWLVNITGWEGNFPKVLMFIIAFVVINRLVGFAFWIFDKFSQLLTNLPFIRGLNRFFGFLLGIFEGIVTIGLIVYFVERFPLSDFVMSHLSKSIVAPYTTTVAEILLPLLPEGLKMLHSTVDYLEGMIK